MQNYLLLLSMIGLAACGSSSDAEPEDDDGEPPEQHGDHHPCPSSDASEIEWEDATELGVSPADAFASVAGSCQTIFRWDATGSGADVTPLSGESRITVALTIDRSSATIVRFDSEDRDADLAECQPALAAQADVRITTDDGVFEVSEPVDLFFRESHGVRVGEVRLDAADHEGSLVVALAENEGASLRFRLAGGQQCVGEVVLGVSSSSEGVGMASAGSIGSWSSTGCGLNEVPVELDEPFGESESSLRELIVATYADLLVPGTWDDDRETELQVSVEISGDTVCREDDANDGAAFVPVRVTYGTTDGSIAIHETDQADVRVSTPTPGEPSLQLWISETQSCEDESDTLSYTLAGCDTLDSVELQLGLNARDGQLESGEGLNAYESHRDGNESGGASEVRVLTLEL